MTKTEQIQSQVLPAKENQNLGVMVFCGKCLTGRVFKIDEAIKLLQTRQSAEFTIVTKCEKCGQKIGVGLAWIDATKEGYSYRDFDKRNCKEFVRVQDRNGLAEMHD